MQNHTSNFPTIVYRQIISLIIHCITIPVGEKFTYTKLTVPLKPFMEVVPLQGPLSGNFRAPPIALDLVLVKSQTFIKTHTQDTQLKLHSL